MKKSIVLLSLMVTTPVFAQTFPVPPDVQIVRVQPRYQTVYQRQCYQEQVMTDNSGTGTVLGAIVGGVVGNQIGGGHGKDAATAIGVITGAAAGGRIGQDQRNVEVRTNCQNVPVQTQVGELVTVMYKGRYYTFEAR